MDVCHQSAAQTRLEWSNRLGGDVDSSPADDENDWASQVGATPVQRAMGLMSLNVAMRTRETMVMMASDHKAVF